MILWFAACAVAGAWAVLRDRSFDYRLVALGALMPDLLDAIAGHRALAHTLVFAVGALVAVMLVTMGRRALRRHVIALPIGLLAHLVLDGVWADQSLFWWPAFGSWGASPVIPGHVWLAVRELVGLVVTIGIVGRFGLRDGAARQAFWRTGRLAPC